MKFMLATAWETIGPANFKGNYFAFTWTMFRDQFQRRVAG
jgi:hypothetical protein